MAEGVVHEEKSLEQFDDEVECEGCIESGDQAEAFCRQCAEFICKECVDSHKIMKLFASHEVVSLEDLKQGRAREIAVKEPLTKKCHIHEEPLTIYCFDCDTLICHDCTEKEHRDHKFKSSKIVAADTKKKIVEKLGPLKQVAAKLSSAVKNMQTTQQEVQAEEEIVASTIHTSFDELQQMLEKRENKLFDEVLRKMQDSEFVSMQAEIRSRIQREVEEHSKAGRSMELVEEADMGVEVRCAEALQQLFQTKANITQLALDPAQCTVRGEGVKTAEVHQTAEVTLTILARGKGSAVVFGQLKSVYDGSVVTCEVDQSGPGEYRIQYTPTVRGRHELTMLVDGQQVAGSPFPVFVSIHPTQLEKPVKFWNLLRASGIAINSVGDIIFCESCGDISELGTKNYSSLLVAKGATKLKQLGSISTDDEDNIYATDRMTNKVMKCNRNGRNVQVHEVKQVKGPGHCGVAVVGDEVMLCERGNEGTIMVYDKKLKHVRRIEHGGMGTFIGVSSDSHRNLYVADKTNNCIQVFSNDGVFLRSFGCDGDGVKRLHMPYYVCVFRDYVYVTCKGPRVSVFTTVGDYVTSFSLQGVSNYISPYAVCTDKDGFVYISSGGTENVLIF